MANATKLASSSDMVYTQLSRPTAQDVKLAVAVSKTATTLVFNYPLKGSDGVVITEALLIGIRDQYSYVETVYIPAGGISADGLTATDCVRGIRLDGLDWTTGDTDLAVSHKAGDAVFCNISGIIGALITAAINGTIANGGTGFTIGTEPGAGGETATLYRTTTAGVKLGFLRWGITGGEVEYSDNGTDWTAINDVTASDLLKVSSNDTTPGYLNGKLTAGDGIDLTENGDGGDEDLGVSVDVTDLISGDYGIEEDTNNLRVKLATDSGLEFSTGLRTKIKSGGGIIRDSDGLSTTESGDVTIQIKAGEDIDGSVTPKSAFISNGTSASDTFPLQIQETENNTGQNVYGINYMSQTFTTSTFQTKITRFDLLFLKITGGAFPAGNAQLDVYAVDGAHKPTGASLGSVTFNPTAVVNSTYMTWITLALALTVTPSTEYAMVVKFLNGTAAEYIRWIAGNGNTYSGGQAWASADAGGTWGSYANDHSFRVWGYEEQTAGSLYMSHSTEPFRGMVDGFVTSNTASGALADFKISGKTFTGLTGGSVYYIHSTAGIINTAGSGLKVGKATSEGELKIDFSGGFIEKAVLTAPTLTRNVANVEEYQAVFQCGFKPSKIEIQLYGYADIAGGADIKMRTFNGRYVTSLYGTATEIVGICVGGTNPGSVVLISAAGSFAVSNLAGTLTLTHGTFTLTNTGLTHKISTNDIAGSVAATAQAIFYR